MANALYTKAKENLLRGAVNLEGGVVKAARVARSRGVVVVVVVRSRKRPQRSP